MHDFFAIALGLAVGILTGLMGIGGGVVVVPALVYLFAMDQHVAQGTSLFLLLPPLGLGAIFSYWKNRNLDLPAGIACALGFLFGGYFGGRIAVSIPSRTLQALFGAFLILSAAMLWRQAGKTPSRSARD
ncbi:MAG: TSUP family transporter [Candidatus Acidiferrales bacterium]